MYTEILPSSSKYAEPTYDNFLTISSLYSNPSSDGITNANSDSIISSGAIGFDQTTMGVLKTNQNMQSSNFETGISGWQIKGDGDVEFNNGVFRGAITATTIDIGGADDSSFHVDINGNLWSGAALFADGKFKVTSAGALTATSATITGNITITGGSGIASLSDAGNLAILDAVGAGNCDTTIISGGKIITGLLTASNIQTGTLNANLITVQNFTVGTNVNIGSAFPASSAGDMAYEDLVSAAKLDSTVIVGGYIKTSLLTANNIQTGTLNASLVTVSNINASNITTGTLSADRIATGTITASKIASHAITGDEITASLLDITQASIATKLAVGISGFTPTSTFYVLGSSYFQGNVSMRHLDPISANAYNCGGSSLYWFAVNSVYFTKQGGFGSFDGGVELQDGSIVSDVEAITQMKVHPKMMSQFGVKRIDPKTIPPVIIHKAKDNDGKLYPRDKNDRPYMVDEKGKKVELDDGEDLGATLSIVLGAIKELATRIKSLEDNK